MSCDRKGEGVYVYHSSAVGSMTYAMVCTRPDISFAISVVSMANPGKEHWQSVKWILCYLKGSMDVGIVFDMNDERKDQITDFVDADYARELDKRRSTTGHVFLLAGAPVSWKSTLQSSIALSTTEAEYMAAAEAAKEALWLRRLVSEFGLVQITKIHCDSQSVIHLAKNQVFHSRTSIVTGIL